mmetsp:Transcript_25921/g.62646  ORF Transcript_25921/g.62646 Transcript_25921/m.62646 type:complete len:205 (-) Transcript_25921:47-661(-)
MLSLNERPCCFMMPTDLTGYVAFPVSGLTSFTMWMASHARLAKKSDSRPNILEERVVLAMLNAISRPRSFVFTASWSLMNLIDSFIARRYPVMIVVGWIEFFTSSLARLSSSAATITTEVVPSPTSLSCISDSCTSTRAAGCSTSSISRIVAPSFVIVTSPRSSTSILSSPIGPNDVFTTLATEQAAVTFWVRTSCPVVRSPLR